MAAGEGITNRQGEFEPVRNAVGQRVLFHPACGEESVMMIDGKSHRFIRDVDVKARLE